jgi:hypothetical protein
VKKGDAQVHLKNNDINIAMNRQKQSTIWHRCVITKKSKDFEMAIISCANLIKFDRM